MWGSLSSGVQHGIYMVAIQLALELDSPCSSAVHQGSACPLQRGPAAGIGWFWCCTLLVFVTAGNFLDWPVSCRYFDAFILGLWALVL